MSDIKDTICKLAWTYPIIDIGRRELRNCCSTTYNKLGDTPLDIDIFKNLEIIKQIKRDSLTGVRNVKCSTCWLTESAGLTSKRTGITEFAEFINAVKWQHLTLEQTIDRLLNLSEDDINELVELEHASRIEISLSTHCDLKCVYCSPVFSTQWATEALKYKEISPSDIPKNSSDDYEKIWWEWFETRAYKTATSFTFVGGEPLINDRFYYFINKIVDFYVNDTSTTQDVELFIVTNLNTPPKYFKKLEELIEKVNNSGNRLKLGIGVSFESTGDRNSFIRSNSIWEIFSSNFDNLLSIINRVTGHDNSKIFMIAMPTHNSLSISDLPNYLKFILNAIAKHKRDIKISTNHVIYPLEFAPHILTEDFVKYINDSISIIDDSSLSNDEKKRIIEAFNVMQTAILNESVDKTEARRLFVKTIDKLCQRRFMNFHTTFPEMKEFYNFCKSL